MKTFHDLARRYPAMSLILGLFLLVFLARAFRPTPTTTPLPAEQVSLQSGKTGSQKEESPYLLGHPAASPKEEYQECYIAMRENEIALVEKGQQFKKDWIAKWEHRGDTLKTSDDADWACLEVIYSLGQMHDGYLDPDTLSAMKESMTGGVAGIGAEVGFDLSAGTANQVEPTPASSKRPTRSERRKLRDEMTRISNTRRLKIAHLLDDSPAKRSGLQDGDIIEKVDDKPVNGLPIDYVVTRMIRGTPGTEVKITVRRADESETISIIRDKVKIHPVVKQQIGTVYHVRLKDFMTTGDNAVPNGRGDKEPMVVAEMRKSLQQVAAAHRTGQKPALVLDLRGNPGGMLPYAERILQMMMHEGTLFVLHQRDGDQIAIQQKVLYEPFVQSVEWQAGNGQIEPTINVASEPREDQILPDEVAVVVLVDEGSASASEIVAGTLQAHRPLTSVVGQITFGKYVGQHVIPLSNDRAVKITSFTFYPGGRSIEGVGVIPDVVVNGTERADSETPPATTESSQDPALDAAIIEARVLLEKIGKTDSLAQQARSRNKARNDKIFEGIKKGLYTE